VKSSNENTSGPFFYPLSFLFLSLLEKRGPQRTGFVLSSSTKTAARYTFRILSFKLPRPPKNRIGKGLKTQERKNKREQMAGGKGRADNKEKENSKANGQGLLFNQRK
jgi:hypothetical protein